MKKTFQLACMSLLLLAISPIYTSCGNEGLEDIIKGDPSDDDKPSSDDKKPEAKKIASVRKEYVLTVDKDLVNTADITVTWVDESNVVHTEKLTSASWSKKTGKASLSRSDLAMSVSFKPSAHTRASIDNKQFYDIGYNLQMNYAVAYTDGTTEMFEVVNKNPLTEHVQGQYLDLALDAASMSTTTSVAVVEQETIEPTEFWEKNNGNYESVIPGVAEQVNPSNVVITQKMDEDEYVDLLLPSGTLWCTHNVGATKPSELGGLYGWGDATGYQIDLNPYYYYTFSPTITNISATRYDICRASNNSGRMPTREEWEEMLNNTNMEMGYCDGTYGQWRISKKDKTRKIFLPESGNRYGDQVHRGAGVENRYWTATLYTGDKQAAYAMWFTHSGNTYKPGFYTRSYGAAVRAVKNTSMVIN